jgi:hypothetical protein
MSNIRDLFFDFDCALRDNAETDIEALKLLFEQLKREYPLAYIDEAYNEVIRCELYGR